MHVTKDNLHLEEESEIILVDLVPSLEGVN